MKNAGQPVPEFLEQASGGGGGPSRINANAPYGGNQTAPGGYGVSNDSGLAAENEAGWG